MESFPQQYARTRRFSLGAPRDALVTPDGGRVLFLRSRGGEDPLTCLWCLELADIHERLVADPQQLDGQDGDVPPEELARRERLREQASGIVVYAADRAGRTVAFALSGRL